MNSTVNSAPKSSFPPKLINSISIPKNIKTIVKNYSTKPTKTYLIPKAKLHLALNFPSLATKNKKKSNASFALLPTQSSTCSKLTISLLLQNNAQTLLN
jgi:hypothetical protein